MLSIPYSVKKIAGYMFGFILFFAPFALFQKSILYLLGNTEKQPTIHTLCIRIPIEHILSGQFFSMGIVALIGTILLLVVAFIFGALFCGFLCPAGAFSEYISKIIPYKLKINWSKYFPLSSLRYGFLFGFILAPFTGGLIACAYCNFYAFDLLFNYVLQGQLVAFPSSLLLTMIFWLVLFGLFTQGGRGYCIFFCPIGAIQNLMHYLGRRFSFTWQLRFDENACCNCRKCIKVCPMTALSMEDTLIHNKHTCILCMQCKNVCPVKSITYNKTIIQGVSK